MVVAPLPERSKMNTKLLFDSTGANLAVIGNLKGINWLAAHSEPKPTTTSAEYRAASETAEARKTEVERLLPHFRDNALTVANIVNAVKAVGGNVGANQVKKWLGESVEVVKADVKKAYVSAVLTPVQGLSISKAERYFFDALLQMVRPEDIQEAKRLVEQRMIDEAEQAIRERAQAELKALNLDSLLSQVLPDDAPPTSVSGSKAYKV